MSHSLGSSWHENVGCMRSFWTGLFPILNYLYVQRTRSGLEFISFIISEFSVKSHHLYETSHCNLPVHTCYFAAPNSSHFFKCERHLNTLQSDRDSKVGNGDEGDKEGNREEGDNHTDQPLTKNKMRDTRESRDFYCWIPISKWSMSLQASDFAREMTNKHKGPQRTQVHFISNTYYKGKLIICPTMNRQALSTSFSFQ